jgi:hypothetical protein
MLGLPQSLPAYEKAKEKYFQGIKAINRTRFKYDRDGGTVWQEIKTNDYYFNGSDGKDGHHANPCR